MNLVSLTPEEKIFSARIDDMLKSAAAKNSPVYSQFLDSRKQMIARHALKEYKALQYSFWGGYAEAEHKILALFNKNIDQAAAESQAPLAIIKFSFRKDESITHRDFLGALMALRISRESIGDIIVSPSEGFAHIFVLKNMAEIIISELKSAGRTSVSAALSDLGDFIYNPQFQEIRGTVSSYRLDCIVALLLSKGRTLAQELIESENVSVNHLVAAQVSKQIKQGDVISIKHNGRYIIESFGAVTKKGRNVVICKKYL